ncbi:MAG: hypothetical protein AWU57_1628 [Marinobacter sp. T13-3]|nr:MAG: hypothetical protein AWU57_1628 [Marinobacter sp. T13-3]
METRKVNISTKELSALLGQKDVTNIRYSVGETLCVEAIEFSDGSSVQLQGECDGQVQIESYRAAESEQVRKVYPVLLCNCGWEGMRPELAKSPRPEGHGGGDFSHCPACLTPVWEMRTEVM